MAAAASSDELVITCKKCRRTKTCGYTGAEYKKTHTRCDGCLLGARFVAAKSTSSPAFFAAINVAKAKNEPKSKVPSISFSGASTKEAAAAYAATGTSFFGGAAAPAASAAASAASAAAASAAKAPAAASAVSATSSAVTTVPLGAPSAAPSMSLSAAERRERIIGLARSKPNRTVPAAAAKRRRSGAGPALGVDEDSLERAAKQRAELVKPTALALIKELAREQKEGSSVLYKEIKAPALVVDSRSGAGRVVGEPHSFLCAAAGTRAWLTDLDVFKPIIKLTFPGGELYCYYCGCGGLKRRALTHGLGDRELYYVLDGDYRLGYESTRQRKCQNPHCPSNTGPRKKYLYDNSFGMLRLLERHAPEIAALLPCRAAMIFPGCKLRFSREAESSVAALMVSGIGSSGIESVPYAKLHESHDERLVAHQSHLRLWELQEERVVGDAAWARMNPAEQFPYLARRARWNELRRSQQLLFPEFEAVYLLPSASVFRDRYLRNFAHREKDTKRQIQSMVGTRLAWDFTFHIAAKVRDLPCLPEPKKKESGEASSLSSSVVL